MQEIASYKRRVFLKDHPVVTQRIVLSSAGTAQTLLAGTVIAAKTVTATSATTVGAYAKPGDGETAADRRAGRRRRHPRRGRRLRARLCPRRRHRLRAYLGRRAFQPPISRRPSPNFARSASSPEMHKEKPMADIDYFDSRVLTGVINRRPVKYDIFGNMFRRQSPKATELFELHVVSRGVSMLPSITNAAGGTMRRRARRHGVRGQGPALPSETPLQSRRSSQARRRPDALRPQREPRGTRHCRGYGRSPRRH